MSAATVLPTAVYGLARRPEELPRDLRLRSAEWGVLFAVTGRHTVAQVGVALGLAREPRDRAFANLLAAGLLVERPLTQGEYLRAAASVGDDEPRTLAAFLRAAPARPTVPAPVEPRPAATPPGARPAPAAPVPVPFRPLALPEEEPRMPAPAAKSRSLNLHTLIRFIVERAEAPEQGQLDVYRVFLRVDPEMLRRAGVSRLTFDEERRIDDPELARWIAESLEATLGVRCPEAAWG